MFFKSEFQRVESTLISSDLINRLFFSVVQSCFGDFDDKLRAMARDGGNVDGTAMLRHDFL